jgi:DNA-binding MarR family transcriptional regulator
MDATSSSDFTQAVAAGLPVGPPLIGALLRVPLEEVRRHMLERLHEHGFTDLDAAHLNVLQYPGPQGKRPSELAVQLQMSKQALNYLLGQLELRGYLERHPDSDDLRSKRIVLTERAVAAIPVIRDAVAEVELEWSRKLGAERFAELRGQLADLYELISPDEPLPRRAVEGGGHAVEDGVRDE